MNQPKFKMGDKVRAPSGKVFIVCDIRRDAECDYIYNEDRSSGPHYAEFDLELYQEPQKKKLYAYVSEPHNNPLKCWMEYENWKAVLWRRSPDEDIEYPETLK